MFGLFKDKTIEDVVTPTGPDFKKAKKFSIEFNNTTFEVSVPKHAAQSHYNPCNPRENYDIDKIKLPFASTRGNDFLAISILRRTWNFRERNINKNFIRCSFNLSIYSEYKENNDLSYFHPRAFENALASLLTFEYKAEFFQGQQMWLAPCNWQEIKISQNRFAKFSVRSKPPINKRQKQIYFTTPITDHHFIVLWFEYNWNIPTEDFKTKHGTDKEMVNTSEVEKLIDNIISSVNLELSPEAMLAKAKAIEGLDDISLVKEFPPLKWDPPTTDD